MIAREWSFIAMCEQMRLQMPRATKALSTLVTFMFSLGQMNFLMPFKGMLMSANNMTDFTDTVFAFHMGKFVDGQVAAAFKGSLTHITHILAFGFVNGLMNSQVC